MEYTDEFKNNKMVVYMIINKINNKKYIGITTNSLAERYPHGIKAHHNPHLRKSVLKYGQKNFEVTLLEKNIENINTLQNLEIKYIEQYDTCNKDKGYNKSLGGFGVRQTERTKEHCLNLSKAKKGINPLASYTPEQMAIRNAKISKAFKGENNPMWKGGESYKRLMKLSPEERAIKFAHKGESNPMYGKNIKDYMAEEAYEEWKLKVAHHGKDNGMARKTIIIYEGKKYEFDYAQEGIEYFKNKGEHITRYWFYKGVTKEYRDIFQFVGYEESYEKYVNTLAV